MSLRPFYILAIKPFIKINGRIKSINQIVETVIGRISDFVAGAATSAVSGAPSAFLFIVVTAWMIMKVRCPHCGQLLELKLYNIDYCRYCGKSTDVY